MHLETIGFNATAAAVAGSVATVFTGDSATIRAGKAGSKIALVDAWLVTQGVGFLQVTSPSMSDTTRGLRMPIAPGRGDSLVVPGAPQLFQPQDALSVTIGEQAVPGDIAQAFLSLWYEDVPGIEGRFMLAADVEARTRRIVSVYATLAAGATGNWSGSEALNAESDLLRANTDYAVLGIRTSVLCGAIGIRSPDWGNVRVAVPGSLLGSRLTSRYFDDLSWATGLPTIPVLNSANKTGVFLDCSQDENGADPIVGVLLAELTS